jgi:endonuclease III
MWWLSMWYVMAQHEDKEARGMWRLNFKITFALAIKVVFSSNSSDAAVFPACSYFLSIVPIDIRRLCRLPPNHSPYVKAVGQ